MNINSPKCHICGTDSIFLIEKDGYTLYSCPECDLAFVYPQPTSEFLKDKVYSHESGFQSNRVQDLSRIPEFGRLKKILTYLEKEKPGASILDVGSGGGHFMYWAKKRGFDPKGIELNKRLVDSAVSQGLQVYNGFLNEAPYEGNSFDVVFLGEIIEHVNDPRSLIQDSVKFLKKNGLLIITTPNINCFWSHITLKLYYFFGIPWSAATPPYHLFEFNNENLDKLVAEEGLGLHYETYLLPPRIAYELGSLHLFKRYKKSRKLTDLLFMIFSFGLYILLYVINLVSHPFLSTDFSMIKVYKKSSSFLPSMNRIES